MRPLLLHIYKVCLLLDMVNFVVQERLAPSSILDLMAHVEWSTRALPTTMTPIPGADGRSTAYLLTGTSRDISLSPETVMRLRSMMADNDDFFVLASVKQEIGNAGSILSLASETHRYLELESSGLRDELRLYYSHNRQMEIETFPFRLADNQWHTLALGFSQNHVEVFIDCNKVYERSLKSMDTALSEDERTLQLWLGQRHAASRHAYFKGAIESVKFIASSRGIIEQCPHASIACPSCSQFKSLEHSLQQLHLQLNELTVKLAAAENRLSQLESCECLQSCDVNGTRYQHGQTWRPNMCSQCTCLSGRVVCEEERCPAVNCKNPVTMAGQCCPVCLKQCYYHQTHYDHGEGYSPRNCMRYICEDGTMRGHRQDPRKCPVLNCSRHERIKVPGQCCKFCKETDFCGKGHQCHINATCINLATRAICQCNLGFHGDGNTCLDQDECLEEGGLFGHHCHRNTHCVNTPGSYRCECIPGYRSVDDYMCEENDECATGAHECSPNADCTNSEGSYSCACRHGYQGDGRICQPLCSEPCLNGGVCISPGVCQCRKGFIGNSCELDLDECELGMSKCHAHSQCVNLPGSYHCICQQGFHSSAADNRQGALCRDIDECSGWGGGHDCPTGTRCLNTQGSYECVCAEEKFCQGACRYQGRLYQDASQWRAGEDTCSVCKCMTGDVFCHQQSCNCSSPAEDLQCCPHCDRSNFCVHQNLPMSFYSGQSWTYQCQQCQCTAGQVDCWELECPRLSCTDTVRLEGDCCPRCAQEDPCHVNFSGVTDNPQSGDANEACVFDGAIYQPGDSWGLHWDACTTCTCKAGHVCCAYDQTCGQRLAMLGESSPRRSSSRQVRSQPDTEPWTKTRKGGG